MNHYIIVKLRSDIKNREFCISHPNRHDLMIHMQMEPQTFESFLFQRQRKTAREEAKEAGKGRTPANYSTKQPFPSNNHLHIRQ